MCRATERKLIAVGPQRTIECCHAANGTWPAADFIDRLSKGEKRKLNVLFRKLADHGRIENREQFKKVEDKIWEFKRGQIRIGCFQIGNRWLLTDGFIKKRDDWPKAEIERANRLMNEHLIWERTNCSPPNTRPGDDP